MRINRISWKLIGIPALLLMMSNDIVAQWNLNYAIGSASGNYIFAKTQIPDNLVEVVVPLYNGSTNGFVYQWESCLTPEGPYAPLPSGDQSTFIFSAPLAQTTYFRRMVSMNSGNNIIYSNVIKIQIVSTSWESLNYTRAYDILVPGLTDPLGIEQLPIGQILQTTTYVDGFERPIEKISKETATPSESGGTWGDAVQFSSYDEYGQTPLQYLPYTTNSEAGKFKSSPLTEQPQYYTNMYGETPAYTSTTYDNSPLSREVNAKSAGSAWATSAGKSITYDLNDFTDNVQIFTIGANSGDIPSSSGAYPSNSLFKTVHSDEKGNKLVVYTDKAGRVILSKEQIADNPSVAHAGWICTYNIYDDFARLRYQIQPEAVKWLDANFWSFSSSDGQKVLNEMCFRYEYDEKGREVLKKVPGASELNMLYDNRDRLVFNQDGNQRAKSPAEWQVTLYDELDRTVSTALYTTTKTLVDLQSDINNAVTVTTVPVVSSIVANLDVSSRDATITTYVAGNSIEFEPEFESLENDEFQTDIEPTGTGESSATIMVFANPIPAADMGDPSKFTPLRYNFYDDYSYAGAKPFDNGFSNGLAYSNTDPTVIPVANSIRTLNMPTGSSVRVLGTATFLLTSIYYDERGKPIQINADNIKSGTDITTHQYHFDGRLLSSDSRSTAAGTSVINFDIVTKYTYDKIGRSISIQKKYGSNDFKTINSSELDDIGRVKVRHLDPDYTGTNKEGLESLEYSYNIHGELTGINKDYALKTPGKYAKWNNFFGLYLGYDNKDAVFSGNQLDGHLAGMLWTTQGDDVQRKYDCSYDNAGRLINALYSEKQQPGDNWANNIMDFSVTGRNGQIEYDLNGNLQYMLQKGIIPGTQTPLNVDDLKYVYNDFSNKLRSVTDNGTLAALNGKLGDFADGSNGSSDDYVYDLNGNLVVDLNKNATGLTGAPNNNGISYNYLDKPEKIHISGKGTIQMVYDAGGNKLQKIFTPDGGGEPTVTSYVNNLVYQGDNLQYINFEDGRIRMVKEVPQENGCDRLIITGNMDLPGDQRGAYDYYIRDNQNNVRMVLTEETHLGSNSCTMETGRAVNEEPLFGQVDANGTPTTENEVKARFLVASIPGQSSGGGWQDNTIGDYVSRVSSLTGKTVGPNTLIKVMAGDQISAKAIYYYPAPVGNISNSPILSNLLTSLAGALTGGSATSGMLHGASGNIVNNLTNSLGGNSFIDPGSLAGQGDIQLPPAAYLYVLFFDERMNFVPENSNRLQVSQSGTGAAPLILPNLQAPKNGYAYVYVCNASDQTVYFDNIQVTNNHGPIIEEDHYYAYGLKIAGISSHKLPDPNEGHIDNKDLYNGKELVDDADLNWYDYGFRSYDPQIGRFTQLDPLSDKFPYLTPYQYASCDPIKNIDLDGLEGVPADLPAVTVVPTIAAGVNPASFARVIAGITINTLEFFGNNAIIYNYISSTGTVLWTARYLGDNASYRNQRWTYQGSAQISYAPTAAEREAAQAEQMLRAVNPDYARTMGFLDGIHDMLLNTLYIFNTDLKKNTLVKAAPGIWSYLTKSELERDIDIYNAISKIDFSDPYSQGRVASSAAGFLIPVVGEEEGALTTAGALVEEGEALDGSFSIWDWEGYPEGIPKPRGPFRLIEGEEYAAARNAANNANRAIREEADLVGKGVNVHELTPVKFGGSPTDLSNKIILDASFHASQVTPWWNKIMNSITQIH